MQNKELFEKYSEDFGDIGFLISEDNFDKAIAEHEANPLDAMVREWISVKDKLPEYSQYCIIAYQSGNGFSGVAYFTDLDNNVVDVRTADPFYTITHWMRLPEPPTA